MTAPEGLIDDIEELVTQVDTPVEDTTVVQRFKLKYADPGEIADELGQLFPGDNGTSSDATRSNPVGFRGFFGGFGGGGLGGRGESANSSAGQSDRMKKLAAVIAVPDRRTSSILVTASTNLMPQIEKMILALDADRDRVMTAHIIPLHYADPVDVMQNLTDLFTSSTSSGSRGSSSTTSSQNPLLNRQQTQLQQQNSTSSSAFGSGSGGRSGGIGN